MRCWRALAILIPLLAAAAASADSSVWVAERGGERVFLAGSVHVLRPADYPLPEEFAEAYRQADAVVLETDIERMESPELGRAMLERMRLPEDETLRGLLSAEAYAALQAFTAERGIALERLDHLKPAMVVLTLIGLELERLGVAAEGVDHHFNRRAREDGKPLGALERVEAQLDYLAAMGEGRESAFVLYSLRDLEQTDTLLGELIDAWRDGDLAALRRLYVTEMRVDFPDLYRNLLVRRNREWLPRIEAMFEEPGTELVLVGAAHLVGPEGLLELLERRGYEVSRL